MHLAVDAHGMPVRIFITSGTTADYQQATNLTNGIAAEYLLADKGYDSDNIIKKAAEAGMQIVYHLKRIIKFNVSTIKRSTSIDIS